MECNTSAEHCPGKEANNQLTMKVSLKNWHPSQYIEFARKFESSAISLIHSVGAFVKTCQVLAIFFGLMKFVVTYMTPNTLSVPNDRMLNLGHKGCSRP
jgi:hypothetical protein